MTTYLVNNGSYDTTAATTNAFNLDGSDNIVVTSSGSLFATGTNSSGLYMDGSANQATIEGEVYGTNDGILAASTKATVNVDSMVYGENDGLDLEGSGSTDFVAISNVGIVQGGTDGILANSNLASIVVNGEVNGATNDGIHVYAGSASIDVAAGASVSGGYEGIGATILVTAIEIQVNGDVTGTGFSTDAIGSFAEVTNITVGKEGSVADPAGVGIELFKIGSVVNDGTISGAPGADAISCAATATVTNAGLISGTIAASAADLTVNNTGTIDGGIMADGATTVENAGTITGGFTDAAAGQITIDNLGTILGTIIGGTVGLTNSGVIHGAVGMLGESTLINSGKITGAVDFSGTDSSLSNHGEIHGNITLSTHDNLVNTGTIHGNVVLGSQDTIDTSKGEITGTIKAANLDTFDFSGAFGHNTILDFVASGAHHDTINFLSDDFANYSDVQSHMTQVGSDVVVKLDAGDTIVLEHQTLANLTSSDFTFG